LSMEKVPPFISKFEYAGSIHQVME